ncbi:NAD(P)-dependent dehydrogenase (short-subunit alcohol dehydrogenase family) [Gillisia sp. Hel_I_86]|uniref:SDR family oxidoreductase n=1 Tax=Gillisia sp. Hel_I_86 TaxID=1249981 RepID=UPI00119C5AFD|nr:SDR family oxidoreductase [Gillisia sp. Hel_I_86]TVZ28219.1 NAD(P)-dependent dehydrogenase (short-subunit alcohol dehydrogenase family) [Gillisia sp. Hel_I_86]
MIYNFDLGEKTILVTGGYGYLGKAIAESLLFHNAKVIVLGRSIEKFKNAFKENEFLNSTLLFQNCDISKTESIKSAFLEISKNHSISVLVNNAFYSSGQSPEKMEDKDWENGIDGSLNSVFRAIREIIPYFKSSTGGKIINVSSMYGVVAPDFSVYEDSPNFLNPPHYGAAKAGVIQLTKYYASYLGKYNVNVNTVTPGPFPSESVQQDERFVKALADKTCLNRIGKPNDLGGIFTFLSSDAANFITGQNIVVDGGWTIK